MDAVSVSRRRVDAWDEVDITTTGGIGRFHAALPLVLFI